MDNQSTEMSFYPPEFNKINLWKLLVTLYGLCDAPRAWYLKVKEVLEKIGARNSEFDASQ